MPRRFRPKVVILTTFETGNDTGDKPGEFQYWVEREKLDHSIQVPGLQHPVRYNDAGVFGVVTGTCDRSGLGLMALGLDPRFDLSRTYWLTAAIAGVDAGEASVGSAAWARWIVDGDNVNEIDDHDTPPDWPYGILPYGAHRPDEVPAKGDWSEKPMAFELDAALVDWAYHLTHDVALPDSPEAQKFRAAYKDQAGGPTSAFRAGRRHAGHGPLLARPRVDPMGGKLDAHLYRRPGAFRDDRMRGPEHGLCALSARQGGPRGPAPLPRPAHGEQLFVAPAGNIGRRKPAHGRTRGHAPRAGIRLPRGFPRFARTG